MGEEVKNMSSETNFFILSIVENKEGQVLLVKKQLSPILARASGLTGAPQDAVWFLPVGHQRIGEIREECVIRSVIEETGYVAKPFGEIRDSLTPRSIPDHPSIIKCAYLCNFNEEKTTNDWKPPEYVREVKWVNKSELKNHLIPELIETCPPPIAKVLGLK